MGIKTFNPYTPSRRAMTQLDNAEITKSTPEKSLTVSLNKTAGRNNQGKITVRHHGGGSRRKYRIIDFKRNKVDDRSFDGLRVATMHRVKGLEFKYVFIVAANSRIIPLPSAINKTDPVSEVESVTSEKCLLYVAMTRAQKGVYITSYGRKSVFLKS